MLLEKKKKKMKKLVLTKLLEGKKVVGCKLVLKFVWYKARLASERFTQTHGLDFHETFAPIAKLNCIKVLSLAAYCDWPL